MNCCFLELQKCGESISPKHCLFFFFFSFLNVSPCRSQQFFSQLLSVMLNISEGCMRWLLDNCAVFLMHSGRMNQETKRVHLEQEENLWSWLRAALIVFRLCLCPAEQKFPSIPCQSCFPLISHHVMLPLCIVMKLQCHYDVWCQSLARYSLVIWLQQSQMIKLPQSLPSPETSYPNDLGKWKAASETDYYSCDFFRLVSLEVQT